MKVLFIGGTGNISTTCSRLAIHKGHELFLLNRGNIDRQDLKSAKSFVPGFKATIPFKQGIKRTVEWFETDHRGIY